MMRGVRPPPQARLHPIALIEDEASIQAALMEVINALMRNTIDLKRANLILRALHIAVKNARYAKPAQDHVGTAALGGPGRAAAVPEAPVSASRVPAARVPAARVNDELSIH